MVFAWRAYVSRRVIDDHHQIVLMTTENIFYVFASSTASSHNKCAVCSRISKERKEIVQHLQIHMHRLLASDGAAAVAAIAMQCDNISLWVRWTRLTDFSTEQERFPANKCTQIFEVIPVILGKTWLFKHIPVSLERTLWMTWALLEEHLLGNFLIEILVYGSIKKKIFTRNFNQLSWIEIEIQAAFRSPFLLE